MWTLVRTVLVPAVLGMTISGSVLAESLDEAFSRLLLAMDNGDREAMAEAACVDARVAEKLKRMEQLGMVEDADPYGLVEAERAGLSERLELWSESVRDALAEGFDLDTTRVDLAAEADLTAQGILGIVLPNRRGLDIPVYQLKSGRWCLEPLATP